MIHSWTIPPAIIQSMIRHGSRFTFKFFGHWKIEGVENVTAMKKPIIFVANHSSETDAFMVPAALPWFSHHMPIFYVSRNERNFYSDTGWRSYIYGGLFFKALGAYPVYSGFGDYDISLRNHKAIINAGYNVFMFPEGKRHETLDPARVHGGVAYLAYTTGAPVVPVGITGNTFMPAQEFFTRKRYITTRFGAPMFTNDIFKSTPPQTADDYKNGARNIMERVKELVE